MAATPKPIRKQMKEEKKEHRNPKTASSRSAFDGLPKGEVKKKSNKLVKHMNKLNVFESPKHEKLRKEKK